MAKLKVVIDSNILVSILKGNPRLSFLYTAFKEGRFELIVSSDILKELASVLYRPRLKINHKDTRELFRLIKLKAVRVKPKMRFPDACRDPKDNFILEMAIEAKADIILTNDIDLLIIKTFHNVSIITPREFTARLK